jgi:phosphatidylglycerol:prolipoprotein diacylglycerol transferase
MYPVVFRIGSITITSFGLMMFASFIVGAWILGKQLQRYRLPSDLAWDLLAWIAVGGLVGAKLYYVGLHWDDLMADPVRSIFSRGGLVWYGGFIGGVSAYYLQIRRRKLPMATMFDATAPALAIAYATGRLGCFLVGDDYGLPTDAWYGVAFPEGSPPSTAGYLRSVGANVPAGIPDTQILSVHPTQVYEIALALVMFTLLWNLGRRAHRQGQLFGLFMIMYAIERFLIEFVRAKSDRLFLGLSTSQLASMLVLGIGAFLFMRRSDSAPLATAGKGERSPKPAAAPQTGR